MYIRRARDLAKSQRMRMNGSEDEWQLTTTSSEAARKKKQQWQQSASNIYKNERKKNETN